MHLLILGGTGPCGQLLIRGALDIGHTIVTVARSPQKFPDDIRSHASVTIIEGQLTDEALIERALVGIVAVVSALGPPPMTGPLYPSGKPLAHAYSLLIRLMKKHGVKRLIALGTPSMKDEQDKFSLKFQLLVSGINIFAHQAYNDVVAIGETVRTEGSDLLWTIVRVPLLNNGAETEVVAGYVGDGRVGTRLSRAGFASFCLKQVDSDSWHCKAPLISSP